MDLNRPGLAAVLRREPNEVDASRHLATALVASVPPEPVQTGGGETVRTEWMKKYIGEGLAAFEAMLGEPALGRFCHGDRPTMADVCLVPQVYNARRWDVPIGSLVRVNAIAAECEKLPAFARAYPKDPAALR